MVNSHYCWIPCTSGFEKRGPYPCRDIKYLDEQTCTARYLLRSSYATAHDRLELGGVDDRLRIRFAKAHCNTWRLRDLHYRAVVTSNKRCTKQSVSPRNSKRYMPGLLLAMLINVVRNGSPFVCVRTSRSIIPFGMITASPGDRSARILRFVLRSPMNMQYRNPLQDIDDCFY